MKIIKKVKGMQKICKELSLKGKKIGFVPTMGYLHQGHVSLIEQARKDNDIVVLSIYVNPTQFGPKEDFKKYPRDLKSDTEIARQCAVDIVFVPTDIEMYPKGYASFVDVVHITNNLCGLSRPGHFKGVATVVSKLFNIVEPDVAYFGQKDIQQCKVIKRMVADLNMNIKIKIMPIKREKDGLAISSRNVYLSSKEKEQALVLYKAILCAGKMFRKGEKSAAKILTKVKRMISLRSCAKIDYIKIVDTQMQDVKKVQKKDVMVLAVFMGKTRLIDNVIF